jgi:hypothetical protein
MEKNPTIPVTLRHKAPSISALVKFIETYVGTHPDCSKEKLSSVVAKEFKLREERSVYVSPDFAVRFSSASGPTFSNVILSLSTLQKSVDLARSLSQNSEYLDLGLDLNEKALQNASKILNAARIDNINKRGNIIEQIITGGVNVHGLADLNLTLRAGTRVLVDVKTKVLALTSRPKGYNIDKFLQALAGGNTVFTFFFIGADLKNRSVSTRLVSVFDATILKATRIQYHWAGRNSRGVTQLTGDLTPIFERAFRELIEPQNARGFLQKLIYLSPTSR